MFFGKPVRLTRGIDYPFLSEKVSGRNLFTVSNFSRSYSFRVFSNNITNSLATRGLHVTQSKA